jgi:hypothetical protein
VSAVDDRGYFAEVPGDRYGIAVAACACPATMMIAGAD